MKPLLSTSQDSSSLQALGRASIQIIHDLKNQLNGLKLYATFLRKRLEKSERPQDEVETLEKLIAGLDRAAGDLSTLVQYGRPIELRKQPSVDIQKIMRGVAATLSTGVRTTGHLTGPMIIEADPPPLTGEFDPAVLTGAFKSISLGAMKMQRLLEMSGYHVTEATNGVEAVRVAEEEMPDVILMDLSLPIVDGLAATRRIRQLQELKDVPIIAVSAHDTADFHAEALASGCDAYITKPIDYGEVEDLMTSLISRQRR